MVNKKETKLMQKKKYESPWLTINDLEYDVITMSPIAGEDFLSDDDKGFDFEDWG